ncbi:unnamed protein product [Oikopleura dioica]|uniref:Peptidase S1 domain-containing protein n=1 Tax=Oikopleura dioica TaxID=34765 RepID=E4Y226_OIKDI|nr:unnamed protein product [Oikopleura dioica]
MTVIKRLLCFYILHARASFVSRNKDRLPSLKTCTHESNYNTTVSRIVGGVYAKENDWPFLVRLDITDFSGNEYLCGGTIIDNYWILRLKNFPDKDLCLIEFDEDIIESDPNKDVRMACLTDTIPKTGTKCWIAGWGTTYFGGYSSRDLKSAQVEIMDIDYCKKKSDYPSYLFGLEMICAGKLDKDGDGQLDGGVDACQGDSGGPLICNINGKAALVGVVSWGIECASEGYPGVYSSPAYSRSYKWIREILDSKMKFLIEN